MESFDAPMFICPSFPLAEPKLFPINPRTYGGPLPNVTPVPKPELTELGKKISGF